MEIDNNLKKYIEENIFPNYFKNDQGHNLSHISYVIDRSLKFASTIPNINYNMVYTIAAYHDIGHYIDAKNHEKVSSEMMAKDDNLKEFFTDEEIQIMVEAVCDHRASSKNEPRSIYGKIVSSADRNTDVEISLKRAYSYNKKNYPELSTEEIIVEARKHLADKFGRNGYAAEKMYFKDEEYEKYLADMTRLTDDEEEFREEFCRVNNI